MKMNVVNKSSGEMYEVYDITYDKTGYPHFLIYKENQWVRASAKHFRPATFTDYYDTFEDYHAELVKGGIISVDLAN